MFSQANKKKAVVGFSGSALHLVIELASVPPSRVRMSANKVVAGVRCAADLPNIHPQDVRQSASTYQFTQLEGLAGATPWRFESSLPQTFAALRRELRWTNGPFREPLLYNCP
jgi:hypothetical protein